MHFKEDTDHDVLIHYGVLGMKWGMRRAKSSSGLSRKERKEQRQERKEQRKERRKERKEILNEYSLNQKLKSAQLQKDYARGKNTDKNYLDEAYKTTVKKYGKKKVDDAVKYNQRVGNIAQVAGAGVGIAAVIAYNQMTKKR